MKLYEVMQIKSNTPGTRGWSRLRDRTLAVKSRKIKQKSAFVKQNLNLKKNNFSFFDIPSCYAKI